MRSRLALPFVTKPAPTTSTTTAEKEPTMRRSRKTDPHKSTTASPMPLGMVSNGDGTWSPPRRKWRHTAKDVEDWTPCGICGGAAGKSTDYAAPFRVHRGCKSLTLTNRARLRHAVHALLDIDLTAADAAALDFSGLLAVTYRDTPDADPVTTGNASYRRAWSHLDEKALKRAVADLPRLRKVAGIDPATCTDGPCAWCGVAEAVGWELHGHKWADGSPAPLCGGCTTIYVERGLLSPDQYPDQRRGLGQRLTGVRLVMGEPAPPGLRCFIEDHGRDDGGEAWAYLPREAVERLRWEKWLRYPGQAPAEHRAEAHARRREEDQRQAAERAVIAAATTQENDVYGFGGGHRG